MNIKLIPLLLIIILIGNSDLSEPKSLKKVSHTIYFSTSPYYGQTTTSPIKAGLAWSNRERGWPKNLLGFDENAHWHNWIWDGDAVLCGGKIPMIWSRDKNNFPYFVKFTEWLDFYENWQGKPYTGCVMFANEPDRPDQAAMSITEVAELFLEIVDACPACKIIGPGYSSADDGQKVRQVWDTVRQICGINCPALNNWYANQPHHFPIPLGWDPNTRLEIFCDWVYGAVYYQNGQIYRVDDGINTPCEHPIWPTIGWRTCYPNVGAIFPQWLQQLEDHPKVEKYFIFTTYQEPETRCQFSAMLDWNSYPNYVLSPFGNAVRSALRPIAYP